MNSINRLEETWTPEWDLGLQAEFGFLETNQADETGLSESSRPNAWAMASKEALNRQLPTERGISGEPSNIAELIRFFENLSKEIAD